MHDASTSPIFWHLDDIDWTPVQRQRNADGSESVVREKWPIIRLGFLSAHVFYEPGMVVRRHGHRSNHIVFVLGGDGWIGSEPVGPGMHIHVPLGAAFGPIVAGPAGLICWELSFGEFGGWGDQPELYEREIAARGVSPLPDPPLEIGDWFVDPRGDWGAERSSPKVDGMREVLLPLDSLAWEPIGDDGARMRKPIDTPEFSSTWIECPADVTIERTDTAFRLYWIDRGSVSIDGRHCPAGTHIEVPAGVTLGRFSAGPEGFALLELVDRP